VSTQSADPQSRPSHFSISMGRRKATSGETEEDNKRHRTTGPASKGHWVEVNETLPPVLTSPTAKLKPERPPAPPPVQTDGTVRCSHWNCKTRKDGGYPAADGLKYCLKHKCEKVDCPNQVQGSSKACKAHGGGKRCTTENCTKSAQGYTPFCNNHGGGKKCMNPDCVKPARVR